MSKAQMLYRVVTLAVLAVLLVGSLPVGAWSDLHLRLQKEKDASALSETTTIWHIETVDSTGKVGRYKSLALDANDHPHIIYQDDWPNDDLKYAYFDGTSWLTETAISEGRVGMYNSLALDTLGRPHISYQGPDTDLYYASRLLCFDIPGSL